MAHAPARTPCICCSKRRAPMQRSARCATRSSRSTASIRSRRFERDMGKNKENRTKLGGLERQIARHEAKIAQERCRFNPDQGLIKHWQTELKAWKARIA